MQFCIFPFLFVQQEQNRLYPTSIIAVITNNTEIRCGRSSISAMPTPVQNRTSPITFFTSGTPSRTSASARLLSQSMLPVPFLCRSLFRISIVPACSSSEFPVWTSLSNFHAGLFRFYFSSPIWSIISWASGSTGSVLPVKRLIRSGTISRTFVTVSWFLILIRRGTPFWINRTALGCSLWRD